MLTKPVRCVLSLVALLLPLLAGAAEPSAADVQRARAHYEAGSGLYQLGRYDDALREFSAGYALSHRPQFALNMAQCYRRLGRFRDARDMIQRFLDEAPADAAERPSANALLAEIDEELRRDGAATPAPPAVENAPPPTSAPSLVVSAPPPAPPPHRGHRAAYVALGITGAVLVVGAALTVGLLAAFPTQTVPMSDLGAVRFGR